MNFVVSQESLLSELQFLQGVAEKKKTIPILSNILLQAEGDSLTLAATDLEVSLTGGCEAQVQEPGGITVSAKKIFEVVRSLTDEKISFVLTDGNWLEITSGNSFFRLVGLTTKDFPEVPVSNFSKAEKVSHDLFNDLINRTIFAVTQEDARYALNGALLEIDSKTIRMVATDAHRLAMVEEAFSSTTEVKAIVPKKTLTELRNLGNGEEMLFTQDKNHLFFKVGHRVLASRVIEGQFPSYEKVIPPENPLAVVFAKETMAGAIRRVSLLASERSRAIKFTLNPGEAIVSSSNPELGEAKESVAIQYEGSELEVCFNAQYILDFLTAVAGEEVVLRLKDPASQGLLEPHKQSSETSKYKCVIMPMRM